MYYLDTSAVAKLIVPEDHSAAFETWWRSAASTVSSALIGVELIRAVRRLDSRLESRARDVLARIARLAVDDDVLDRAAGLPGSLRSLDAIHVASAVQLGPECQAVVSYDARMVDAAALAGLAVLTPR